LCVNWASLSTSLRLRITDQPLSSNVSTTHDSVSQRAQQFYPLDTCSCVAKSNYNDQQKMVAQN